MKHHASATPPTISSVTAQDERDESEDDTDGVHERTHPIDMRDAEAGKGDTIRVHNTTARAQPLGVGEAAVSDTSNAHNMEEGKRCEQDRDCEATDSSHSTYSQQAGENATGDSADASDSKQKCEESIGVDLATGVTPDAIVETSVAELCEKRTVAELRSLCQHHDILFRSKEKKAVLAERLLSR